MSVCLCVWFVTQKKKLRSWIGHEHSVRSSVRRFYLKHVNNDQVELHRREIIKTKLPKPEWKRFAIFANGKLECGYWRGCAMFERIEWAHDAWPKCVHKLSANVESNRISRLSFLFKEDAKEMKKETHKISLNKSIMCEYWIEWRRQTSTSTLMGLDTAPHRNQWATNNSLSSIS